METSENNVISKDDFTDVHNNKTGVLTYHSANLKKIFLYYSWISYSSFSWGTERKLSYWLCFYIFGLCSYICILASASQLYPRATAINLSCFTYFYLHSLKNVNKNLKFLQLYTIVK